MYRSQLLTTTETKQYSKNIYTQQLSIKSNLQPMKSLIMYSLMFIGLISSMFAFYYYVVKLDNELKENEKRKKFYDKMKDKSHLN